MTATRTQRTRRALVAVVVAALVVMLAPVGASRAEEARARDAPRELPRVLAAVPKGERPFLHAVITADDVAAMSDGDERIIREISAGEGDDGYLEAGFFTAAMIEGRDLGAGAIVVSKPLLRTQTLVDKGKRAYAIVTTLEVDFLSRARSGAYARLFFADEAFPGAGDTCRAGVVVVTSEEVARSARWPSRLQLLSAMAKKTSADRWVTDLRFEPAQRGGRKLRGEARVSSASAACGDVAPAVRSVKLKRKQRHFYAPLSVNGVNLGEALIDTGATSLALPQKSAFAAKVEISGSARVETASGTVEVRKGSADVVSLGGMTVRAVDVVILPDGSDALIGMAVLEAFDIAVSGDTMTLSAQ